MSSRTSMSSSASGALRLAEEYLARGDVREALNIYSTISEADPLNLDIKSRLGELCAIANHESDAVKLFAEVASGHIRQGRKTEAVAALNKVLKLNPSDPDTLMDLGDLCSKCGLVGEAERYYLKAAGDYDRIGETSKLAAAYELAAAVAPANAELQMRLGAVRLRSGRLEDSYRAFMKAAAEFSSRGDDSAAQDAYSKAVKVALSGAEGAGAAAEVLGNEGLAEKADTGGGPAQGDRPGPLQPLPKVAVPVPRAASPRKEAGRLVSKPEETEDGRPVSKPEGGEDGLLAGKIATAEILFGFGRLDKAIALLKDLLRSKPDDPRIHRKLAEIYLRSEMAEEAAGAYRELAHIYTAQGNGELASDCMANSRRLRGVPEESSVTSFSGRAPAVGVQSREPAKTATSAGPRGPLRVSTPAMWAEGSQPDYTVHGNVARGTGASPTASRAASEQDSDSVGRNSSDKTNSPLEPVSLPSPDAVTGGPGRLESVAAAVSRTTVVGRTAVRTFASRAASLDVTLRGSRAKLKRPGTRRYLVAAFVAVALLAIAGGYLLIRSSLYRINGPPQAAAQMDSLPVRTAPSDVAGETQASATKDSAQGVGRQAGTSNGMPSDRAAGTVQRGQSRVEPETTTKPSATGIVPGAEQLKPTPPALGPIESPPGTTGIARSDTPGALATDGSAVPPPPPTPTPTVRRSAVIGGGELLKRVEPVYPQAARSAHITGTVTVELSIDERGNVVSARATSGPGMLQGAAQSAARGFKFKPITLDGLPVKSSRTVLFHFKE